MQRRTAPPPLDPHQPVLYIECCPTNLSYRKRARELFNSLAEALRTLQPELQLQLLLNVDIKPRSGAFEVAIAPKPTPDVDSRHILWTGLTRVPVSAKVPHVDDIIAPACIALNLRRSDASSSMHLVRTSDRDITKILQRHRRHHL